MPPTSNTHQSPLFQNSFSNEESIFLQYINYMMITFCRKFQINVRPAPIDRFDVFEIFKIPHIHFSSEMINYQQMTKYSSHGGAHESNNILSYSCLIRICSLVYVQLYRCVKANIIDHCVRIRVVYQSLWKSDVSLCANGPVFRLFGLFVWTTY